MNKVTIKQQSAAEGVVEKEAAPAGADVAAVRRGLSGKLLWMTVGFVMIAEVLIFVPSIANFRNVWLQNRLDTAEAASIVYLDVSDAMLSDAAREDLLRTTGAVAVAVRKGATSTLIAKTGMPGSVVDHIDLDQASAVGSIRSALSMFFADSNAHYRVFGSMRSRDATIELVQEYLPIQQAMWVYARNVLVLSIIISIITAGLVYLALYWLIVRPIIRLSANMDEFSRAPENHELVFKPSRRQDELGLAEKRLSALQRDLQQTLRQKQHLAELGLAVSKINHDLRNILASAQLFSDRLTSLPDPTVQRFAPKLIRTIDRAVEYTKSVITYGKALEAPPSRRRLLLDALVLDVAELLGLDGQAGVTFKNEIAPDFEVVADPEHLFRVMMNLCRNAVQAMEDGTKQANAASGSKGSTAAVESGENCLTIKAMRQNGMTHIRVCDTGPGIPPKVRETLFEAFKGSTRSGGTGLGMAIAAELVRAHGGMIVLEATDETGTVFCISLPDEMPIEEATGAIEWQE